MFIFCFAFQAVSDEEDVEEVAVQVDSGGGFMEEFFEQVSLHYFMVLFWFFSLGLIDSLTMKNKWFKIENKVIYSYKNGVCIKIP